MPQARTGLRRKLRIAFLLQAAAIAVAAVVCVFAASWMLGNVLVERALHAETAFLRERLAADPAAPAPDTFRLDAWILRTPADAAALPAPIRALGPGYHRLAAADGGLMVLVDPDPMPSGPTLVLAYRPEQVDRLAFWLGLAPLAVLLVAIWLIGWLAYRASRRAVAPVVWLADQVQRWDPKRPEPSALHPENLPDDVADETRVLATSLHDYASRIDAFVDRERNFTRDASHELRTPLAVIRVAGDLMSGDGNLSAMSRRALGRIQGAGRDMEALIEAFLILAREGETGLPDDDFAVGDILEEEIAKARVMLAAKPVDLVLDKEADFQLHAPARVLAVIVANLLRNAVQHTDEGSITVTLRRYAVTVADTGVGMSAEALSHAFEPYWHGDPRDHGRGIGLSIVRRLSRRYGWQIALDSAPQRGTRATLTFPTVISG